MKCSSCGTENPEGARFCMSCASPLAPTSTPGPAPAAAPPPAPLGPYVPPRPRKHPYEDLLGLLSLAIVLTAVAVLVAVDPLFIDHIQQWTATADTYHTVFVRPPDPIIVGFAWFFGVVGVLDFLMAGLRRALRWPPLHVVSRILSGVGDLTVAALIMLYASRTISGPFLILACAGTGAILLSIYVALGMTWFGAAGSRQPRTGQYQTPP